MAHNGFASRLPQDATSTGSKCEKHESRTLLLWSARSPESSKTQANLPWVLFSNQLARTPCDQPNGQVLHFAVHNEETLRRLAALRSSRFAYFAEQQLLEVTNSARVAPRPSIDLLRSDRVSVSGTPSGIGALTQVVVDGALGSVSGVWGSEADCAEQCRTPEARA